MNKPINTTMLEHFKQIISNVHSFASPERQGATSEVIFLHTDNGQFACKVAKKSPFREWLKKEAIVMKCLNEETNLPVPTFYQFVECEEESYLLMSLENGIPLREALQKAPSEEGKVSTN